MAREMKVFGGCYDGRNRVIVAAETKRAAYQSVIAVRGYSMGYKAWDDFTAETGNDLEVSIATAKPGTVFVAPMRHGYDKDFVEIA